MSVLGERLKHVWNAFMGRDPTPPTNYTYGFGGFRPDRLVRRVQNERSIINSAINKIAVDAASIGIKHVRLNEEGNFKEIINDSLNQVLTSSANTDQTGRAFIQDLIMSMLDEGCIAAVPVDTSENPNLTDSYDVFSARRGKITKWMPKHIHVEVYDENDGKIKEVVLAKRYTPIIENPFYAIMNEPNSTLQRLIRVLNQIDRLNQENSAGKVDLIVKVPYGLKGTGKKAYAEERRHDIEAQLTGSQYGIAYIDATEQVIQLNRSIENNFWEQAKDLKQELFNQLGFSMAILDGTADEKTMLNYNNRTIEPILSALTEEMERKWISKTARSQGQAIRFYRDPFKLIPVSDVAEIADKLTRNEIMTSNEVRSKLGMLAANDPKADMLVNANLNQKVEDQPVERKDPQFKMEENT